MDVTELNQKVSEPNFLDVRESYRKYNLIKNIDKTSALVLKVRNLNCSFSTVSKQYSLGTAE